MWPKFILFLFLSLNFSSCWNHSTQLPTRVRTAVFKLKVLSQTPNATYPWQNSSLMQSSGTGFLIDKNHILTNAHVVSNAKEIVAERDGDDHGMRVTLKHIAHDADLALLEIAPDDLAMIKDASPLSFENDLPHLHDPVLAVGFPMGGEQLSVTVGVVSRIETQVYSHAGDSSHLALQVDAAINPGNSGGPVLQDGEVVGVAFQAFTQAENTGYVIPTVIVQRFLKDIEDGHYDGHPHDELYVQDGLLENPALREFHKMGKRPGGVVVGFVTARSPFAGLMKEDDILLRIAGKDIGLDGKVSFQDERVSYDVLYDLLQIGDEIEFAVLRDGKELDIKVKAARFNSGHTTSSKYLARPPYVVFCGLVLTPLSREYLATFGDRWYFKAPFLLRYVHLFHLLYEDLRTRQEFLVLSARLSDPCNAYAEGFEGGMIDKIDNVPVLSLKHAKELLEAEGPAQIRVDFYESNNPLYLNRKRSQAASPEIRLRYGVEPPESLGKSEGDL